MHMHVWHIVRSNFFGHRVSYYIIVVAVVIPVTIWDAVCPEHALG